VSGRRRLDGAAQPDPTLRSFQRWPRTLKSRRLKPPTVSPSRELFDAYAHCADRRDAEGQKALFTDDTVFAVYMDGDGSEPTYVLNGREALTPVFDDLNRYEATTHFNGQSTVTVDGDRGTGESYTIAHHVYTEDGTRKIMVASLRYLDTFSKLDGLWYFAERVLILDWSETRSLTDH
jgi:SnoaL-like domain